MSHISAFHFVKTVDFVVSHEKRDGGVSWSLASCSGPREGFTKHCQDWERVTFKVKNKKGKQFSWTSLRSSDFKLQSLEHSFCPLLLRVFSTQHILMQDVLCILKMHKLFSKPPSDSENKNLWRVTKYESTTSGWKFLSHKFLKAERVVEMHHHLCIYPFLWGMLLFCAGDKMCG